MRSAKIAFIVLFLAFLSVVFPHFSMAEPAASSLPAAPLNRSSTMIPVESVGVRSLRAVVASVQGDVSVQTRDSQASTSLVNDTVLRSGDIIKTGQGSCLILIDGKTKVALTPLTTLKISNESLLDLSGGNIMVKLAKLKKGSTFEVTTPTATAVVRGTTLYIQTGNGPTKLYVDETKGGVLFKNIFSGASVLVPAFSLSSAFANGQVDDPVQLTPEQKEAFFKEWQGAGGSNLNQQFGIEEIATLPNQGVIVNPPELNNILALNDALWDKIAEQNISGLNGFLPAPADPATDPKPKDETVSDSDRETIIREIDGILEDQEFDVLDASATIVADAQTGKVMKDVHGNRVRVDQYIFQPTTSSAAFLSLTSRTGGDLDGITGVLFATQFNDVISGPLRDLPWNDYMNVVTREELTGVRVPGQYEQFIVHEHISEGFLQPSLHPLWMTVVFTEAINQNSDLNSLGAIMFGESFTAPFVVEADQGTFWVQGVDSDFTAISKGDSEFVLAFNSATQPSEVIVNGRPGVVVSSNDAEQAQTVGFAGFLNPGNLGILGTAAGLDFFRNSSVHPAQFIDQYGGDRMLYGVFLPINDDGQVIDAEGFRLHGIRDLLTPNSKVTQRNNGNPYNLEVIFAYGSVADNAFQEIFRIDAIITPEIFGRHEIIGQPGIFHPGFGLKDPETGLLDRDTIFPSKLEPNSQLEPNE